MAEPVSLGSSAPAAAVSSGKPTALSCLQLPSFSEACGFIDRNYSCLVVRTHRRHIAMPPKCLNKKRTGIKENLDADLLKYNVELEGVPVAYDNIKLIGELGDIFDDIGYIYINIEADFVIFQPQCGQKLVGVVNKKSPSHIGCLVHGCFNASIPRPMKMPIEAWQHLDVNVGDKLEFEVFRMDSDAVGVFCIRGRMYKKMQSDAVKKLNEISMEENANVPNDEVQTSTETSEEGVVGVTSILSGDRSKKKSKKRFLEETLSPNECIENQADANLSLQETPKKKRKKQKHQEILSQDHSVEVDGSGYNSAMENSLTHPDSSKNADLDASVDNSVVGLDNISVVPSSQEHKTKKSKKKKRKDHPDLESSVHNGITEGSSIVEDSILGLETEPGSTKKKHKKKHKNSSGILDQGPENGIGPASSQETPVDAFIIQQEAPKVKKHKKKHQDTELDSENTAFHTKDGLEDSNTPAASNKDISERKVKKRRKESL